MKFLEGIIKYFIKIVQMVKRREGESRTKERSR
jgi:hypothetical protein